MELACPRGGLIPAYHKSQDQWDHMGGDPQREKLHLAWVTAAYLLGESTDQSQEKNYIAF